jgi:hypothetical protein
MRYEGRWNHWNNRDFLGRFDAIETTSYRNKTISSAMVAVVGLLQDSLWAKFLYSVISLSETIVN